MFVGECGFFREVATRLKIRLESAQVDCFKIGNFVFFTLVKHAF